MVIPNIGLSSEDRYYALYRVSEQRCMTIDDISLFRAEDQIYGGPYSMQKAVDVIRERCPVTFHVEADWFAVSRGLKCWLVKNESRLRAGDIIWNGNVSRESAESLLLEHCETFEVDEGSVEPEIRDEPVQRPQPDYQWSETTVPWISVLVKPQSVIETKEVNPEVPPPAEWKSLTRFISVEPEEFSSAPGGVRVSLPDTLLEEGENPNNVALAFFEESWSPSGNRVDARWRLHAVEHNAEAGTFDAELNHASVIVIVMVGGGLITAALSPTIIDETGRAMMKKKASDHFVLHYKPAEIPKTTVDFTLSKLEASWKLLTGNTHQGGLGLSYPSVPVKLDVYYVDLEDSAVYGKYCQGKSGARWIDLNLPKKVANYNKNTLIATITHEVFHFVQFPYEGYSTLTHAWWSKIASTEFPYGWLNEALSTWVELYMAKDPGFVFTRKDPILDSYVYELGLRGLKTDKQGYSAGLFIDFLVRRYGIEVIGDILGECTRQVDSGTARNAFIALRRAVVKRARQLQPSERLFRDMDVVWQEFSQEFLVENKSSTAIDNRGDRKIPFTVGGSRAFDVGESGSNQKWNITVPPLSLVPLASRTYKITPSKRDQDGNALVDCTADYSPDSAAKFEVSTLIQEWDKPGDIAYFPNGSRAIGRLDKENLSRSFTVSIRKANRWKFLSFIPVGLGASTSTSPGKAGASYTLSCKLRTKEEVPEFAGTWVSISAIESYYRTLLSAVAVIKAKPGSRLNQVCPTCNNLHNAAVREFEPLKETIGTLEDKMWERQGTWQVAINLVSAFYSKRWDHEPDIDEEDRRKISMLSEVCSTFHTANNECAFSAPRVYILLPYLKGGFPVRTGLVEMQCRGDDGPVPTINQLEERLNGVKKELNRIAACQEATLYIEPYLRQHQDEAMRYVEELKAKHPWLQ